VIWFDVGNEGWIVLEARTSIVGKGGIHYPSSMSFSNHAYIRSVDDDVPAIEIAGEDETALIHNSGVIVGGTALVSMLAAVDLTNRGTIEGDVTLGPGDDEIRNSGSMSGDVDLGAGEDVYDGRGGSVLSVDGGPGADKIIGGAGDGYLVGGRGGDTLRGGGGDDIIVGCYGQDVMKGGSGADIFIFLRAGKGHADRIKDFAVGEDRIHLENDSFRKLGGEGALSAEAFSMGTKATEGDDRIIYDAATGILKHDANGDAKGGVKVIGRLDKGLDLTHHHFEIV
jgi:Ca2+-binding RTX toxin-like protein